MKKLFVLFAAVCGCMMAQAEEINAISATQGATTDWYLFGESSRIDVAIIDHNPVINGKTYNLADGKVETTFGIAPIDEWVTVRTDGVAGNWNTICMERNITDMDGATFWNVVGETDTEFTLEQVSAPFPAGVGYIIRYTATELKVKYGTEMASSPVQALIEHPIQGNFAEITCNMTTGDNELVGNYVVYQNQLRKVTRGWVAMAPNHAYVIAGWAPEPSKAPVRGPRMTMAKPNGTTTGNPSFKMIKDGRLVIVRDNEMFNAQGMKL